MQGKLGEPALIRRRTRTSWVGRLWTPRVLLLSGAAFVTGATVLAADPFARIEGVVGQVRFQDKALTASSIVSSEGWIETGPKSKVTLVFLGKDTSVKLAEKTKIFLARPDPEKGVYELTSGACLWSVKKDSPGKAWVRIRTRAAVMGVRGTQFIAKFEPLLGEAEVVVYEGKLEFGKTFTGMTSGQLVEIGEGQWGGLGGRFGNDLRKPLTLSAPVLDVLRSAFDADVAATPKAQEAK